MKRENFSRFNRFGFSIISLRVLVCFTAVALFLGGCQNTSVNPQLKVYQLGEKFELIVGETALVDGENLKIKFLSVQEDSRCPMNAYCIWAGNATVGLGLQKVLSKEEIVLNTYLEPKQVQYLEYEIELTWLAPYPPDRETIPQEDYIATLVVRK